MEPLKPTYIAGSSAGLEEDKKPYLFTDQAFQQLNNAYAWRERTKKREGNRLLDRLRRVLTGQALGNTDGAGNFSGNIITILTLETTAEIEAQGSPALSIVVGADTFTETSPGILAGSTGGSGTINYVTGDLTLTGAPAATPITISFAYFPGLPVMGIFLKEEANINDEDTIFFDTKYAYIWNSGFAELDSSAKWAGTDADFFWCTNYNLVSSPTRLFFATNFVNNSSNPIRYYDGSWKSFYPVVTQSAGVGTRRFLSSAKIMLPYYGRLIALNVWESGADGAGNPDYSTSQNFFNRCRFSQIGNPLETTAVLPIVDVAWRSDQFGRGGFIDAPTNEAIVSAAFYKNTLIVFFERSTWQLRYVGEYGLPFLWERISSDFGSESTNSPVIFDEGVLAVGDKAIVSSSGVNVQRIDSIIPDFVFNIRNADNGIDRVCGVRDFQKELVYWTVCDSQSNNKFPSQILVYNYRNNTFATFRDNVTFFGTFQSPLAITWGRFDIFWYDYKVLWKDADSQSKFPSIVSGNQQGFIHEFGYTSLDEASLFIQAINTGVTPVQLTIPNHNLLEEDIIRITGVTYTTSTDLNDQFYLVQVIDSNTIALLKWNGIDYADVTSASVGTYIGLGKISLHPKLYIVTKDFSPYQGQGNQMKLSYVDFLLDATESASMTVELLVNNSPAVVGNLLVGNTQVESSLTRPYYVPDSSYVWHRFYATCTGQFVTIIMTYDDDEMNSLATHEQDWELNAFTLWTRPGGKTIF